MKKYRVKVKDTWCVFGEFSSKEEASKKLMEHLNEFENFSPFDYELEVVECGETNEEITDFKSACRYLGLKKRNTYLRWTPLEDDTRTLMIERLVKDINEKHIEALVALNELFTIAEAWNKADGFEPDFSDLEQFRWFPWFKYDKDAAGLVYMFACDNRAYANASFGSRLCFKTRERAEQFGKQFAELYNKVFL